LIFRIFILLISCLSLWSCRPQKTTSSGDKTEKKSNSFWRFRGTFEIVDNPGYTEVFQTALSKGRPVMISFYTDWCTTCPFLQEEVIKKQPIISLLEENFVSFFVDAELSDGAKLANEYNVLAYPTVLFLNSESEEISKYVGLPTDNDLLKFVKSAISEEEKFQKKKARKK
jgi:thiol:disulfide interchange protein